MPKERRTGWHTLSRVRRRRPGCGTPRRAAPRRAARRDERATEQVLPGVVGPGHPHQAQQRTERGRQGRDHRPDQHRSPTVRRLPAARGDDPGDQGDPPRPRRVDDGQQREPDQERPAVGTLPVRRGHPRRRRARGRRPAARRPGAGARAARSCRRRTTYGDRERQQSDEARDEHGRRRTRCRPGAGRRPPPESRGRVRRGRPVRRPLLPTTVARCARFRSRERTAVIVHATTTANGSDT